MGKQTIKCIFGQRVFDIYDGSKVNIGMKCINRKCNQRFNCNQKEIIFVGNIAYNETSEYIPYRCPVCGHRIFDATEDSYGNLEIKCPFHKAIVDILIGNGQKSAFAA